MRHTFGTIAAQVWPIADVKAYMGHANISTTELYVHYVPKAAAAAELTRAVEGALATEIPASSKEPETAGTAVD